MPQYTPRPNFDGGTEWWPAFNCSINGSNGIGSWTGGAASADPQYRYIRSIFEVPLNRRYTMSGMQVRRDSSSAGQPSTLELKATNTGAGVKSEGLDLSHMYFPVGKWITLPNIPNSFIHDTGFLEIILTSFAPKLDYSLRHFNTWFSSEAPDNPVIDSGDASFKATIPGALLKVDFDWLDPNEGVTYLRWDWNDGSGLTQNFADVSSIRSPSHTFPTAGTYNVELTAYNHDVDGQIKQQFTTKQKLVIPAGAYKANYSYDVSYLDVDVDAGASTGLNRVMQGTQRTTDTYKFEWGDGTQSTKKVASHTYAGGGDYPLKLTITNNLGQTSTITRTIHIDDVPVPEVDFSVQRDFLKASFFPTTGAGTYLWNFGDGTTANTQNPVKTYATPGLYNVTLTFNDGSGPVSVSREVQIVAVYTPIKTLTDALRLEISLPLIDDPAYNYLENPNGELGGFGWITPTATGKVRGTNETFKGIDGWKLIFTNSDGLSQFVKSELYRCNPGEYANWTIQMFGTGWYRAFVAWYDAAGTFISSGTASPYYQPTGTRTGTTSQAPAGTKYFGLQVYHYSTNAGANPLASQYLIFRRAMLAKTSTAAPLDTLVYTDSQNWLDIMGDSFDIEIEREEMNSGLMNVMVRNGDLDPSRTSMIRVGQKIRLRAATEDLGGNLVYENVFSGKIGRAHVTYDRFNVELVEGEQGQASTILSTNRNTNPRFQINAVGWEGFGGTRDTTNKINGANTYALNRSTTSTVPYIQSNSVGDVPCVAGDMVSFSFDSQLSTASGIVSWRLQWVNASGTVFQQQVTKTFTGSTAVQRLTQSAVPAPTGAVLARVQVFMDSGPVAIARVTRFKTLRNESSDTQFFDGDTANDDDFDYVWTGTANASTSTKGTKFIADIPDQYVSEDDPERTVIEINATTVLEKMVSSKEPRGIYRILDLPFIMEGKGVPWIINNSSDQVGTTQVVSLNENSTLADQVAITRDTDQGYAWVNRNNVLVAYDAQTMPSQIKGVFNEDDYTDIDIDYDTDACINSVGITWLRYINGQTVEIPYGPYVDQTSIDANELHHQDFVIHGTVENPSAIASFATAILNRAKTPQVRPLGFAMPIVFDEDIRLGKALLDLYDLVTVRYGHSNIDTNVRVTALRHEISTDEGWNMALGFKNDGAVPSVQSTPSVKSGAESGQTTYGIFKGTTNGNGVVSVQHGLGAVPKSFITNNLRSAGNIVNYKYDDDASTATGAIVAAIRTDTGAAVANTLVGFTWVAHS